ncbi:MAG TPA: RING finger protein [Anaerolineales bacterium]|nr:RING finger protein [Anaerolineales bacterium]
MAARAMSFNPDSTPERWHLGRKLTLLILLVIALALGLAILFRQKTDFPSLVFNIFANASIGVVAGLAARLVLHRRNWFIRGLASAALVIVGLLILGYFTNGKIGAVFPPLGFVSVNWFRPWHISLKLPLQVESHQVNWLLLVYLVIGMDISWIALRAWKRPALEANAISVASSARAPRPRRSSRARALPRLTFPKIRVRTANAGPKVHRKRTERPLISTATASGSVRAAQPRRWNPLHKKPQIQLAVYEEHRCPYCLEEVKRDDPRGVVECEVCHTLHHKDCWDITGACQVPHLNT